MKWITVNEPLLSWGYWKNTMHMCIDTSELYVYTYTVSTIYFTWETINMQVLTSRVPVCFPTVFICCFDALILVCDFQLVWQSMTCSQSQTPRHTIVLFSNKTYLKVTGSVLEEIIYTLRLTLFPVLPKRTAGTWFHDVLSQVAPELLHHCGLTLSCSPWICCPPPQYSVMAVQPTPWLTSSAFLSEIRVDEVKDNG